MTTVEYLDRRADIAESNNPEFLKEIMREAVTDRIYAKAIWQMASDKLRDLRRNPEKIKREEQPDKPEPAPKRKLSKKEEKMKNWLRFLSLGQELARENEAHERNELKHD